nr:ErbB3-binding protein [Paratrimastix eleionoma]
MEDHSEERDEENVEEEQEELDISHPEVVTKYKTAAEICNKAIKTLAEECVPGKKIVELCVHGDALITEGCTKVYSKAHDEEDEPMLKGIAFPTTVCVNNCCAHFSPSVPDETEIHAGDVVQISMGCHIDGFIATGAHTVIVAGEARDRKADCVIAASKALECAVRMMRPGTHNYDITAAINKIAAAYHCQLVEGVVSHEMKRFIIDGNKCIMNRPSLDAHVEPVDIEANEVYSLDIVMSTGEGKTREVIEKPTIFKRAVDQNYMLKMKSSRLVFSEINAKFPSMPFALRQLETKSARMGLTEMISHNLLVPYPVLFEKDGETVARFNATVLVMPSTIHRITGALPIPATVVSEHHITDPELLRVLDMSLAKKKKKKTVAAAAAPAPAADAKKEEESK